MAVEQVQPILNENVVHNEKLCWICHGTEEDDNEIAQWIKPCKCRGTMTWVHQYCLQLWVFEQRDDHISVRNEKCPQCKTEYVLAYPRPVCVTMVENFEKMLIENNHILSFLGGSVTGIQLVAVGPLETLSFMVLPLGLFRLERKIARKLADLWYPKDFGGNNEIQLRQNLIVANRFSEDARVFVHFSFPILSKIIAISLKSFICSSFRRMLVGIGIVLIGNTFMGVYLKYQHLLWNRRKHVILDY